MTPSSFRKTGMALGFAAIAAVGVLAWTSQSSGSTATVTSRFASSVISPTPNVKSTTRRRRPSPLARRRRPTPRRSSSSRSSKRS